MRSQPKPFPRTRPFILEQLFSLASENYSSGTLTNKKIENTQKSFCYTCTCPPTAIQSLFWIYDPKAEAPTRGNPFRHIFFFLFLSSHFNVSDTAAAAFILFPFGPAYLERLSYQRSTNFVSKAADVSGTLLGVNSLLPSVGR